MVGEALEFADDAHLLIPGLFGTSPIGDGRVFQGSKPKEEQVETEILLLSTRKIRKTRG